MNFLGKIFTVLIFVMSVLFMGFAIVVFATHTNWKEKADALEIRATDLETANEQRKVLIAEGQKDLAQEQAARRYALAALEEQKAQAENERDMATRDLARLNNLNVETAATLDSTQKRLTSLTDEVVALRDAIRDVQQDRDTLFGRVVELTDGLNAAEGLLRDLDERKNQLALQNTRMKKVLDAFGMDEDTPTDDMPPPNLDGEVIAVGETLVEISIGSDDGLRVGHHLDVFRGSAYLGKIVVRKTMPDKAVAEVVREYRQGLIRKGDSVATTKLS